MTAQLQLIRLRAGFYVTRDAQWRIVRRPFLVNGLWKWHVERWLPGDREYVRVMTCRTYRLARATLSRFMAETVEQP